MNHNLLNHNHNLLNRRRSLASTHGPPAASTKKCWASLCRSPLKHQWHSLSRKGFYLSGDCHDLQCNACAQSSRASGGAPARYSSFSTCPCGCACFDPILCACCRTCARIHSQCDSMEHGQAKIRKNAQALSFQHCHRNHIPCHQTGPHCCLDELRKRLHHTSKHCLCGWGWGC